MMAVQDTSILKIMKIRRTNKRGVRRLRGDFFDEGRAEGVDNFDENEVEKAPESHDGEGGATSDAAGVVQSSPRRWCR